MSDRNWDYAGDRDELINEMIATERKHEEELDSLSERIAFFEHVRNVMVRRGDGFHLVKTSDGQRWYIDFDRYGFIPIEHADPFVAIDEADKWYKANVEGASHAD